MRWLRSVLRAGKRRSPAACAPTAAAVSRRGWRLISANLSHSGSLALAVFAERPVGCDIQQMRGARLSTAARWFHPSELHYLQAAQTPAETEARFYRLWTLKESYAKATGRGLLLPLQSFAVDLSSGQPQLCGCRLFELRCPDGYYAACCVLD